jgi:predicted DCC family thiol-disulfide oxidoreductase YuxK
MSDPPSADEVRRREAERAHDQASEDSKLLNEAATRDAQGAIRVLLAVNGGSAAALLAFSGGLLARSNLPLVSIGEVVANLKWFAGGLIASTVSAIMAYLTNFCYASVAANRRRSWQHPYVHCTSRAQIWRCFAYLFHGLGTLAAFVSGGLFIYGLYKLQQKVGKIFG